MPVFTLQPAPAESWRRTRRYLAVLGCLVGAFLLVLGLRSWQVERASRNLDDRRGAAVQSALEYAQRDFQARQRAMHMQAREIAREPRVIEALQRASRGHANAAEGAALFLQELRPSESVEIYDVMHRLLAWHGRSMPLDEAPSQAQFMRSIQTLVVKDDDRRAFLSVWWPVIESGRPLGVVRVLEPVEVKMRLNNRFLRDYSLARIWTNATGLEVSTMFRTRGGPPDDRPLTTRALHGLDGTILGWITVEPPSDEAILRDVSSRHADVSAFMVTLLFAWLLAGLWVLYSRARQPERKWMAAAGLLTSLWVMRFALVAMDVPARWQPGKAPLSPLFDPTRFASTFGFGLLRSTGDFVITALFFVLFAAVCTHVLTQLIKDPHLGRPLGRNTAQRLFLVIVGALSASVATVFLLAGLASIVRRAVMDSTLDYFARSGIIPGPSEWLVAAVFCGLLLCTLAVVLLIANLIVRGFVSFSRLGLTGVTARRASTILAAAVLVPFGIAYLAFGLSRLVPWVATLAFVLVAGGAAYVLLVRSGNGMELLTLRGVLLSVFAMAVLLYPMYFGAMDMKRRVQMVDASQSFNEGRDPRVIYGIEQVLAQIRRSGQISTLLEEDRYRPRRRELDSLVTQVLRSSLIGSLGPYDVSMSILTPEGLVAGRDFGAEAVMGRPAADQIDSIEFEILRAMHADSGTDDPLVDQLTGRLERDRFHYAGIAPIPRKDGGVLGWAMARVEPQTRLRYGETSFPRVLLPEGVVENVHANLSIAEFQNGVLVRSLGQPFGRHRVSEELLDRLSMETELWVREFLEERSYLTYYRRHDAPAVLEGEGPRPRASHSIIAVRGSAVNTFDHLFYLLRLTVAGLMLGIPLHLVGVYLRWRAGMLPAARVSFRDKVLNAFLGVGIISVAAVGFVGREVVRESTDASVRSSLRQHLERVEQTLALEARGDELPYMVIERMGVDSLAARAGLDLNVYRAAQLVESSRPQLIQDRLLDTRLPIEVYSALHFDGHRFVTTTEHIGTFPYKTGYRTLLDEQGLPRVIVSVPILPEQERIEEEQARTIAYLFGALLILVLVVMFTASILADALARPIARLRVGLEAVARGRFERSIPVRSRDEIGELVETFNSMQEQLADSRRRLAQQERQLAWREMARQVAHEIRNPLTPMKLSVQHLRRAYEDVDGGSEQKGGEDTKFGRMFDRVTGTLIEQINTLARIADEFSSFAKLPTRLHEELDLNAVIEQAAQLMQVEQSGELVLHLVDEPLIVQADREELRRVYINLLKNAFQAIPADRDGLVVVETERHQDEAGRAWATSRVVDNGTGVPDEVRERIFEPNFSTKTSGMGLGLAIVRKSVEDMRGEIGFESIEDAGSSFWIRLPLVDQ